MQLDTPANQNTGGKVDPYEPNNELDKILQRLTKVFAKGWPTMKEFDNAKAEAKSAINSLTLKQVLELIGNAKTASTLGGVHMVATYELRQSAERIWS